jgi:RNA polymerase sigma-70 factor (ECF subfamily)
MFKGDSQFYTWAHSVATNCVLAYVRKHKTWLQRVFSDTQYQLTEPVSVDEVNKQIESKQLDFYIAKLPEKARIVFVLFAIEGYRHEEISNMMNIAVGSSKAQYHRARQLLKAWLVK